MRPRAEGDDGSAAMRRGSWEGGRLRILLPLLPLSGATPGRSLNSAGEYRPTTGEPGGRGFRRTGDWTTRGSGWGCTTACDRVKEAKEGMANAARKAGFARGGESSRFPAGACIIKIRCSPLSHGRSQSCSPAQAGGIVVATRPRRVKGGPEAASEQIARPKLVPSKRSRSAVATGGVENGARGTSTSQWVVISGKEALEAPGKVLTLQLGKQWVVNRRAGRELGDLAMGSVRTLRTTVR